METMETTEQTDDAPVEAAPAPRRSRWPILALAIAIVVIGVLAWQWQRTRSELDEARTSNPAIAREATKAAEAAIVAMTTYDYRTVDEDFAWVDTAGTARFRDDFAEASGPVKKLVTELEATSKGTVVASGTDIRSPSRVDVLVFVDQSISNAKSDGQAVLEQPRVVATMVRRDGEWLVDKVQLLSRTGAEGLPAE